MRSRRCAVLLGAAVVMLFSSWALGESAALPEVAPTPKLLSWAEAGTPSWLDAASLKKLVSMDGCEAVAAGLEQVNARLEAVGCAALPFKQIKKKAPVRATLWVGVGSTTRTEGLFGGTPAPGRQGYRLAVGKDHVTILGNDSAGLFYGLLTLCQLIQDDGRIPRVVVRDWPDLDLRGTYIGGEHIRPGYSVEEEIPRLAALKLNAAVLEFEALYHLDRPEVFARWRTIAALCRRHFIEPIPELQSLGWGHFVLAIEPRAAEGVFVEKQRATVEGAALSQRIVNLIRSPSSQPLLTSVDGAAIYKLGTDYVFSTDGSLAGAAKGGGKPLYGLGAEETRIDIVPGGGLADGAEVLLTYNHAPEGSITCCPSEPLYQAIMRRSIHTVLRCMEPKYLHIGHDEPRCINRDGRCRARGLSNAELFAGDIRRMRDYAREADPGVRLMMWADALNPHHNAKNAKLADAASTVQRDVIMCVWFYHHPDPEDLIGKSIDYFTRLGFSVTGSPWHSHGNARHWAEKLRDASRTSGQILGEIYTSWQTPDADPWQALPTVAECAWTCP